MTLTTCVHDAYGTHAADMWALYHILREAFVLVHSENMLAAGEKVVAGKHVGEVQAAHVGELGELFGGKLASPLEPRRVHLRA
jgi:hypothetical protein